MARRTKLTSRTQSAIMRGIKAGLTYKDASVAAGICEATFYVWVRRGEDEEKAFLEQDAPTGKYFKFLEALKSTEAALKESLLDVVKSSAYGPETTRRTHVTRKMEPLHDKDGNPVMDSDDNPAMRIVSESRDIVTEDKPGSWTAAMTLLERRWPEEYGRRYIKHEGKVEHSGGAVPVTVNLNFDDGEGTDGRGESEATGDEGQDGPTGDAEALLEEPESH